MKTRQTTTETLDSKTLYLDAKEGGMTWVRRTEVWRVNEQQKHEAETLAAEPYLEV